MDYIPPNSVETHLIREARQPTAKLRQTEFVTRPIRTLPVLTLPMLIGSDRYITQAKATTTRFAATTAHPAFKPSTPKTNLPTDFKWDITALILLRAIFGGDFLRAEVQQAAYPVLKTDQEKAEFTTPAAVLNFYRNLPTQALSRFPNEETFANITSALPGNRKIPVSYVPPGKPGMPVILLSPGASGRATEYLPFITAAHQLGYGVMTYQYPYLDMQGNHLSDANVSFKQIEEGLSKDLDNISRLLAGQRIGGMKILSEDEAIPFNRQVLAGHSMGGFLSTQVVNRHLQGGDGVNSDVADSSADKRNYAALLLFTTNLSFKHSFMHAAKDKTGWLYTAIDILHLKNRAASTLAASYELADVLPSVLKSDALPVYYIQGDVDDYTRDDVYKQTGPGNIFSGMDYRCVAGPNHANLLGFGEPGENGKPPENYGGMLADDAHRFLQARGIVK